MAKERKTAWREDLSIQLWALGQMRRCAPGLLPAGVLSAAAKGAAPYATVYLSARLIDELAGARRPDMLLRLAALTVGVTLILALLSAALERWHEGWEEKADWRRRGLCAGKFLRMDYADVDDQRTRDRHHSIVQNEQWAGWGMRNAEADVKAFAEAAVGILGALALTASLLALPVPEGALDVLNAPAFILALLLLMLGLAAFGSFCANRYTAAWAKGSEMATQSNRAFSRYGYVSERPEESMDIRLYDQQKLFTRYMNQSENAFARDGYFGRMMRGPLGLLCALSGASSALLTGAAYAFVCLKAWAGAFGVGAVTQYVGAITALSQNVTQMMETVGNMRSNAPFLREWQAFLETPNAMVQGSLTTEKRSDREYAVAFRDVSFKYPGSETYALRHVNLTFAIGKKLAVVGENGSGKTTMIKLLCRLYDPQEGQILLNGIDIRKYNYRDYMALFSVVFQDFRLLSQPLGANVAGSARYDRERVTRALEDAGFGGRLGTLPGGLDAQLYRDFDGEGVELSGGEAQKIAIARALYKDAPILILDEPTAALDPIAEAEIYERLGTISGDRTAVYISHRLSSCKFCDEIAVFSQGSIVQQGTHEALLRDENGVYARLWRAQAQYYQKAEEA